MPLHSYRLFVVVVCAIVCTDVAKSLVSFLNSRKYSTKDRITKATPLQRAPSSACISGVHRTWGPSSAFTSVGAPRSNQLCMAEGETDEGDDSGGDFDGVLLDDGEEGDEEGDDASTGQFNIGSGRGKLLQGEPMFRQPSTRQPSPLSDNLIVVGGTILGLAGVVAAFLFLNRDAPPPPY